ncbi:alpha/beta fold hydrolase [Halomonas dongshanensis]|uniref:Alpha/beta fold hydrolase n=1 Tax=Halomonas dongshanensis TaxID=2890835 RepID=A0ABT2EKK6_9GAMM|nr:alpha/beta fold hydrolase [Halomonas dongshanensis]MCS2611122.1 alpha/beta fold hydrolase [Halomonas dongshanensis]
MELANAHSSPAGTRYWRQGEGTPVVLIHGVGLDATMWQAQFAALSRQHDVIAYDMLGHGGSPLPGEGATLDDYARQLVELLDHLVVDKVAVLGFSMGALVARAFALNAPERLSALMILSSVFERDASQRAGIAQRIQQTIEQGPEANIDEALERWFSPAFRQEHAATVAAIHRTVCQNDPVGYARSYALFGTQDTYGVERLENLRAPTLVATGELDPGSTPSMAKRLAKRLPKAGVHVFPGQRHMVPVESPGVVNALALRFFATPHDVLEEAHS